MKPETAAGPDRNQMFYLGLWASLLEGTESYLYMFPLGGAYETKYLPLPAVLGSSRFTSCSRNYSCLYIFSIFLTSSTVSFGEAMVFVLTLSCFFYRDPTHSFKTFHQFILATTFDTQRLPYFLLCHSTVPGAIAGLLAARYIAPPLVWGGSVGESEAIRPDSNAKSWALRREALTDHYIARLAVQAKGSALSGDGESKISSDTVNDGGANVITMGSDVVSENLSQLDTEALRVSNRVENILLLRIIARCFRLHTHVRTHPLIIPHRVHPNGY